MGRKLVLLGTKITDPTAKKLATVDLILPEAGALMYLDPSHPYASWGEFDLNNTSLSAVSLPNLAYDQAKELIPAGTPTTLGVKYYKGTTTLNDGVASKIERTGKGGLHVIFSQTAGDTTTSRHARVAAQSDMNNYLLANKGHNFYVSYWGRLTRGAKAYTAGTAKHSRANPSDNFFTFYTRSGSSGETEYPVTNPPRLNKSNEGVYNTIGKTNTPIFQDIELSGATAPTTMALEPFMLATDTGANGLMQGSHVFYGFYLEDLTVSGRTYAQVNALLKAKFDKDVKTANGRYYNDTFTDPATIP